MSISRDRYQDGKSKSISAQPTSQLIPVDAWKSKSNSKLSGLNACGPLREWMITAMVRSAVGRRSQLQFKAKPPKREIRHCTQGTKVHLRFTRHSGMLETQRSSNCLQARYLNAKAPRDFSLSQGC
jgi:hypothetical protein